MPVGRLVPPSTQSTVSSGPQIIAYLVAGPLIPSQCHLLPPLTVFASTIGKASTLLRAGSCCDTSYINLTHGLRRSRPSYSARPATGTSAASTLTCLWSPGTALSCQLYRYRCAAIFVCPSLWNFHLGGRSSDANRRLVVKQTAHMRCVILLRAVRG